MRIAAIARTDAHIRFRRFSTVVVFLLLSALAYVWVPDPSTGHALMRIGARRALYNSAAIGMATALLGTIFIGLFGFYVVSNAIRRDAQSRCGDVIAATTVGNGQYIAGKFLGNVLFLSVFLLGFGLVSMAMVVVRGEAPLQPIVFLTQYLFIAPAPIVFVAAVAILFESVPWLSGRVGDVAYFFLFLTCLSVSVALFVSGGAAWASYLDPTGMTAVIAQNAALFHTKSISIGAGPFDRHLPPVVYPGLQLSAGFIAQRVVSMLVPLPLLLVARASFHRFDPVRVKVTRRGEGRWLSRINAMLKPLTRWLAGRGSISADAAMTITSTPLIAVAAAGVAVVALTAPPSGAMPFAFAALAVSIADVACRDERLGTTALIRSVPHLREQFVWWKAASAGVIAVVFLAVPAMRAGARGLVPLAVGALFIVAAATALAVISGTAKTFIVLFLSFWYLVVNDRGATPALDFAGFYGKATPVVVVVYALIAAGMLATAHVVHRLRDQ